MANQSAENRDRRNQGLRPDFFMVGDLVYIFNQKRANKLHPRWLNGYVITKRTGDFSFEVTDQLTQRVYKVHARNIRKAHPNDVWLRAHKKVTSSTRPTRQTRYVMTPSDNTEVTSSSGSDDTDDRELMLRWRTLRDQAGQMGDDIDRELDSDDMRMRLRRLRGGEDSDSINDNERENRSRRRRDSRRKHKNHTNVQHVPEHRTLQLRPSPLLEPFPAHAPNPVTLSKGPVDKGSTYRTSRPQMSYREIGHFASSSSESDYCKDSGVKARPRSSRSVFRGRKLYTVSEVEREIKYGRSARLYGKVVD